MYLRNTKSDDFVPFKSGNYKGSINRDFYSAELLDLLRNPNRAFSELVSTIIKDSHTTSSCFIPLQIAEKKVALHIKRYNYQNIFYALKNLFRTSRGKRVWKVANDLVSRSIPTPKPVAFLEQRKGRLLINSFFITQKIDQSLSLIILFQKGLPSTTTEASKRKNVILQQAAYLVRDMHERGIWHRDLKSANLLVQEKAGGKEKLYLVDLDSARIKKRIKEKDKIRDLARLNASFPNLGAISTPTRLRFLKSYLGSHRGIDEQMRKYWKEILSDTQRKLKKSGKRFIRGDSI